jgi:hypothetical protein
MRLVARHGEPARLIALRGDPAMKRYAYAWLTGLFFFVSIVGHWVFGWFAFVDEQQACTRRRPWRPICRDGPRHLRELAVGVPATDLAGRGPGLFPLCRLAVVQGERRPHEAKLDALIRLQAGAKAEDIIAEIDRRYLRTGGHSKPHGHGEASVVSGHE